MKKIKSIFKVLTFINIEIFVMITFMLFTIGFGINYTKNTIDYTERLSFKIKENSLISSQLSENMSQFNLIDNKIVFFYQM
jgi:cell division protein YceG involved in septum cleavage